MTDDLADLDERSCMAAQQATERDHEPNLRRLQDELERLLLTVPAALRPVVAAKAQYLTELFTNEHSPHGKERIEHTLEDLNRLCDRGEERS